MRLALGKAPKGMDKVSRITDNTTEKQAASTMLPVFTCDTRGNARPTRISVRGLQTRTELNGLEGYTLSFDMRTGLYEVQLDRYGTTELCQENLVVVAMTGACESVSDHPAFRSLPRPVVPLSIDLDETLSLEMHTQSIFERICSGDCLLHVESVNPKSISIACYLDMAGFIQNVVEPELRLRCSVDLDAGDRNDCVFTEVPMLEITPTSALRHLPGLLNQSLLRRVMLHACGKSIRDEIIYRVPFGIAKDTNSVLISIKSKSLPYWLHEYLHCYMVSKMVRKKKYAELVEAHCILLELDLKLNIFAGLDLQQTKVGEALESAGRYEQAALLYSEAGHVRLARTGRTDDQGSIVHSHAGIAWRRGNDIERAEAQYALALRVCAEAYPNLSNHLLFEKLEHIYALLAKAYDVYITDRLGGQATADLIKISKAQVLSFSMIATEASIPLLAAALEGLMAAAGVTNCYLECIFNLRKQGKDDARNALVTAARSCSNLAEFRKALLGCLGKRDKVILRVNPPDVVDKVIVREQLKQCQIEDGRGPALLLKCHGCGKEAKRDDLKSCTRCGLARYCSRECQKAHWKAGHKAACGVLRP